MKRFLVRCAIAGAMIGGAAAASFSAVSGGMSTGIAIGSSSTAPAAPAVAAPANTSTSAPSAAVAAPATPPIPSNAQGCVGSAVSTSAHQAQQQFGSGLGDFFKDAGQNTGKVIQAYATANCMKH